MILLVLVIFLDKSLILDSLDYQIDDYTNANRGNHSTDSDRHYDHNNGGIWFRGRCIGDTCVRILIKEGELNACKGITHYIFLIDGGIPDNHHVKSRVISHLETVLKILLPSAV